MALLFFQKIPTSTTQYIEVPVRAGCIGAHIGWPDATSSATITLEVTSDPSVSYTDTSANKWKDTAVSLTGPAASAAGSLSVNVENVRQKRARFKVVTAAVTVLEIWDGTDA